jgi:acyl carrier protein
MDTKGALREFFAQLGKSEAPLADDDPLLSSGLLDSMAIVQLLEFIETEFSVSVQDTDFDPDNFESINTIAALIQRTKD